MSTVDRDVMLEALSALMGIKLKHHTDVRQQANGNELNVFNFLPIAVTGEGLGAKTSTQSGSVAPGSQTVLQVCDDFDAGSGKVTGKGFAAECSTHFLHESQSKRTPIEEMFVNLGEFLDPRYDCDYTHEGDLNCMRGNEPYIRPCGWKRFAIKVLGKYSDGNAWLGTPGWRSHSVPGEWPVSYHGTSIEGATGITESHYEPGFRQVYGRGIYSTPKIEVASGYSKTIESGGKTYKVLMQNRINPQMREKCSRPGYWLIKVPEGTSPEKVKEIVEKSIRPYGILLKEIKK